MARKLRAISLFSGAGGLDLGLTQAGFRLLASIEIDPFACSTLRLNHNRATRVVQADVRSIDPEKMMVDLGLVPGELELLCGGPPCQSFSQIGARAGVLDERGQLVFEVVRFARRFRPQAILMEQVTGFLKAADEQGRLVVDRLSAALRRLGYTIHWTVMNAADYGVPQSRRRVFLVGLRTASAFSFPVPSHGALLDQQLPPGNLQPWVTTARALSGLGSPSVRNGHVRTDSHLDVTPDGQRTRIRDVPEGEWLAKQLHLPITVRQTLKRKDTTKFRRLSRRAPSLTLRCGEIFFHPTEDRYLSPREYARLHGYPDTYLFTGPIRSRSGQAKTLDQHRQVANSVPPPLAHAVAKRIKVALKN